MDFLGYKHNPQVAISALKQTPDDRLICTKPVKIYIPKRYVESGIAFIGQEVWTLGYFAIACEDSYGVNIVPAICPTEPTQINEIKVNDDGYYEFVYMPGANVLKTINLVQQDSLGYKSYKEFIGRARVPWFMSYEHMGQIFRNAPKHTGVRVGEQESIVRLLISVIARDPANRQRYARQLVKDLKDVFDLAVDYVPLSSIAAASDTVSKISGAYFHDGVLSALVNPSDRVESLENIMRQ